MSGKTLRRYIIDTSVQSQMQIEIDQLL